MLLAVESLHVSYGGVRALQGVDLVVEVNSVVALLGANGAGKTTTLRAISGLTTPRSGMIRFEAQSLVGRRARDIVRMGIVQVPEGRHLFPRMSVRENLELGAYLRRDATIRADLERVFSHFPVLAERQAQEAGSLSGGEQQMLAIGRALMARPRLLLLDEPSLGLSPMMVEVIARMIAEINRSGIAVLLVEQNAEMALGVASHAYVLETGRVAAAGTAAELLASDAIRRAYLGVG
ncbi:MAG TPA: ABC transporter ATP-binding protein [Candidatus Methylomirabilis sp.]|nr:ABC transporter ATP-binding protein [Candidatus Methylomirabilis sp.]